MQIFKGDYLSFVEDREPRSNVVTVLDYVGDEGECKAKVFPDWAFPPLDWKGFTLRGYGKVAAVPRMTAVDMTDAVTVWNLRIVENGALILYRTKAERDANLVGDGND